VVGASATAGKKIAQPTKWLAEDVAAACGLNPRLRRSGSSLHGQTRITKRGNAHLRKLFYLPALSAKQYNPVIKDFYEKLVAKGKPKKSALIACERKLLMICYGVVKSGTPFQTKT
jgi:transposase